MVYNRKQDEYLVAWEYDDGFNLPDIHARRVSANGHLLGSEITLGTGAALRIRSEPVVAYAYISNNYLVVWTSHVFASIANDIEGQMVSANGSPVGNNFILAQGTWSATHNQPDVTYNLARNEYLVVWETLDSVGWDVYGLRLQGNGNVLGGGKFSIATWPDDETWPAVAACDQANQYLVVWQSFQSPGDYDIYGRFIKGDGTPDTPDSVYHFPSTPIAEQHPAIACNAAGQHYLAVWEQQYSSLTGQFGIFGQDVSPDKTVGTDFGIMVPTSGVAAEFTNPAVAGGGANYLVVWEHDRAGTSYQDIHGRLFSLNALFLPTMKRAAP